MCDFQSIEQLLEEVIACRSNPYQKELMKKACEQELKNMMNFEMDIEHAELMLPEPPPEQPSLDILDTKPEFNKTLEDLNKVLKAAELLGI